MSIFDNTCEPVRDSRWSWGERWSTVVSLHRISFRTFLIGGFSRGHCWVKVFSHPPPVAPLTAALYPAAKPLQMCWGCIFTQTVSHSLSPPFLLIIDVPPSIPPRSPPVFLPCSLLSFTPSLSSLLSPLSFAPLSPSCLCTQHFLGCGCDVSAVALISSGDVSILLVLLQHQQLPLLFPSFLTQCVFTLLSYQLCTLFYPHCLTFPSLLAIFYFKSCPHLFFPTIPHPFFRACVCACCLCAVTVSISILELSAFFGSLHKKKYSLPQQKKKKEKRKLSVVATVFVALTTLQWPPCKRYGKDTSGTLCVCLGAYAQDELWCLCSASDL